MLIPLVGKSLVSVYTSREKNDRKNTYNVNTVTVTMSSRYLMCLVQLEESI